MPASKKRIDPQEKERKRERKGEEKGKERRRKGKGKGEEKGEGRRRKGEGKERKRERKRRGKGRGNDSSHCSMHGSSKPNYVPTHLQTWLVLLCTKLRIQQGLAARGFILGILDRWIYECIGIRWSPLPG